MNNRKGCEVFLKYGHAYLRQKENFNIQTLSSNQIYRFCLDVYPPSVGRIHPSLFLSASFMAGLAPFQSKMIKKGIHTTSNP
jgi:hypothetical protein